MKVLIGYSTCPLTRAAFEAQGHDVWTCDLLPARDNPPKHLQCDVWDVLMDNGWDMAVLHPMCTYLTVSAAWAFNDPDFVKYPGVGYHQSVKPGTLVGEARREARQAALDNFRCLLSLPFPVAIENPGSSFVSKAIRRPDQIIQPYEFGDDASKATGFWLNGLPLLTGLSPSRQAHPRMVCGCGRTWRPREEHSKPLHTCPRCDGIHKSKARWANQTDSGQNRLSPSENRWIARSATYPGIAAAMGDQWGRWLNAR